MIERDDKRPVDDMRYDDAVSLVSVALNHLESSENKVILVLRGGGEFEVESLGWYKGQGHNLLVAQTSEAADAVFSVFDLVAVKAHGTL